MRNIITALLFVFLFTNTAKAEISFSDVKSIIDNSCYDIRNKANFQVSQKCDFHVTDYKIGKMGSDTILIVSVYSVGFIYNINFIARYIIQKNGTPSLIDVIKSN